MTADIATLGIRVDARQVEQGDRALQSFQQSGDRAEQSADRLSGTMARLSRMAAAVTAALSVQELIKQADAWANLQGRLSLVTKSHQDLVDKQNALFAIAQRTRSQVVGTVDLYAKLTRATQSLNTTDAERLRVTETVNKAMIISGAGAAEAAGAVRQLGQAFAAGALRGDELNSILEGAPRLAEAIAVGMGRTVGDLKSLGEQGKITGEAVMRALSSQAGAIDAEFAKMPTTVGQAVTQIQNAMLRYIGVTDQAGQLSAGLAGVLTSVAGNIGKVAAAVAGLATAGALNWFARMTAAVWAKVAATEAAIVADRAAAASSIAAAEAANVQAAAELRLAQVEAAGALGSAARTAGTARLTAATVAATEAQVALTAAQAAGAGVAGWGARALGMLGGPIGAVTALLGLGVTAWMMWGDKAKEAPKKAADSMGERTAQIVADLEKQIAKLNERNRLMNVAPTLAKADTPAAEQMRAITAEINRIEHDTTLTANERIRQTNVLARQYSNIATLAKQAGEAQAKFDATSNADKLKSWLAKNTEYLSKTEKIAAAIAKAKQELGDAFNADVEKKIRDSFAKGDVDKATNAYKESVKAAKDYIRTLQLERQEVGATEQQKRMLVAAREAEKVKSGPGAEELRRKIMEEAVALDAATLAWERKTEAEQAAAELQKRAFDDPTAAVWKQVEALKAENAAFGLTAEAATRAAIVKVQAALQSVELTERETNALESQLAALNALADEQVRHAGLEAGKKAADDAKTAALKMSDDIRNSLTDALLRGFEAGKTFAENLRDTTVNMFKTMILRPTIQAALTPVSQAMTAAYGPVASAGGSAAGSALGIGGTMSAFGGTLATGFMNTIAGTGLTAGLTAGSSMIAGGSIASGLGMMAGALGPIALGVAAIYSLVKSVDHSGTPHTGGAASASASGTQAIAAESLHFERTQVSDKTQEWVTGVASGIVGILNSTATAFGKTAGYEAATAFADDSSKDGAWGGLLIKSMGAKVLDWQDTRGNGPWAPKVFADGEAGQKQYLAEISKSVRSVMDGIGLPGWAAKMLDALGDAPGLDELAKVVDTINATQTALVVLGQRIEGFAGMSDAAVAALLDASGGIEKLTAGAAGFFDNFYTEGEKTAAMSDQVAAALAKVGLAMPATRDGYRDLVEAQMKLGEAGAPALAVLFAQAAAFAQITPIVTQVEQAVDNSNKRRELEIALMRAQGDEAAAVAAERADELAALDATLRPLQERLYALNDERVAAEKAAKLSEQRASLELELYNLTHTAAEQVAHSRELELAAMDPTLRALQSQTYAMQDQAAAADEAAQRLAAAEQQAKAIASERLGLERELYQAQGDTVALRRLELAAVAPENRALKQQLYDAQDKAAADAFAAQQAQLWAQAMADRAAAEERAAQQIKDAWQGVADSILGEIDRIHGVMGGGTMASAQAQFAIATAQARAGDQDAAKSLPALSQKMLELAERNAVTTLDLRRIQAETAASLGDTLRAIGGKFGLEAPSGGWRPADDSTATQESTTPAGSYGAGSAAGSAAGGNGGDVVAALREVQRELELSRKENKRIADLLESVTEGGNAMRTQ